jgi:hypothetical protein
MAKETIIFSEELEPSYDLGVAGLSHARDVILKEITGLKLDNRGWYVLKIASQNLSRVFPLIYGFSDISVEIDSGYEPDEWMLKFSYYKVDELRVFQVHC